MPSLYEYMNVNIILSNNSMALRIRYSIFFLLFLKTFDYVSREEYELKGISDFLLSIGSPVQRHKPFFVFMPGGT